MKKPKTPYFQQGDVLAVKLKDDYGICFISSVDSTPRKVEYHIACTRYLSNTFPSINDFLESSIACGNNNQDFALKTDCWFNHKDLGLILPFFQKIGTAQFKNYSLFVLSPAHNLEDILEEITQDEKYFGGKIKKVSELVECVIEVTEVQ